MNILILLFSLVGIFASLTAANIERSCNCIDDGCINPSSDPPLNTSCIVFVPVDVNDTDISDVDGYAYQACGNASFADMSSATNAGSQANISNCIQLMEDISTGSYVFLASQLYNNSYLNFASHGDCYLWLLGGADDTPELTDVDDNFFVGNMDLTIALGNSILNYGIEVNDSSTMAVCGTIPNCGYYNTITGLYPPAPDFAFCIGGEFALVPWIVNGGSFGQDMISFEDLPSEQTGVSRAMRSQAAEKKVPTENESTDLIDRSDLETRSRNWFLRCDVGDKSLAQCTQLHDTFCDDSGRLHSDDVTCRFDCSCLPVPRAHCGLHYGFIYDCYDEEDDER